MRNSQLSREGYLMIDHRGSPGLPEDLARGSGLDPAFCQEGKLFETASLTCSHCKTVVVKNPLRTRERHYCPKCDHYICDICAFKASQPDYSHFPFEKFADLTIAGKSLPLWLPTPKPKE